MFYLPLIVFFSSNTGDLTWGHLEDTEVYGRRTVEDDYIQVDRETVSKQYPIGREASHCLIYAKNNNKIFDVYCCRAVVLVCNFNFVLKIHQVHVLT